MGKQPVYYVQKSYRNENGKPSTKYVERLGTLEDLEKRFGGEDPIGEAKKLVANHHWSTTIRRHSPHTLR